RQVATGLAECQVRALQWSRRANATEAWHHLQPDHAAGRFNGAVARTRRRHRLRVASPVWSRASMEPSRERDGGPPHRTAPAARPERLQWSRRANATEAVQPGGSWSGGSPCFNGAVARTRRRPPIPSTSSASASGFNGAVARTRRRRLVFLSGESDRDQLQWSRRANATEASARAKSTGPS